MPRDDREQNFEKALRAPAVLVRASDPPRPAQRLPRRRNTRRLSRAASSIPKRWLSAKRTSPAANAARKSSLNSKPPTKFPSKPIAIFFSINRPRYSRGHSRADVRGTSRRRATSAALPQGPASAPLPLAEPDAESEKIPDHQISTPEARSNSAPAPSRNGSRCRRSADIAVGAQAAPSCFSRSASRERVPKWSASSRSPEHSPPLILWSPTPQPTSQSLDEHRAPAAGTLNQR